MTRPNSLPIVIPCAAEVAQGFASEKGKASPTPVRVISPGVIALLLADKTPKLQKEHGPIDPEEEKRLRGFVHLADAVNRRDLAKLDNVARSMARLRWPNLAIEPQRLYERIVGESLDAVPSFQGPIHFLRTEVSHRASAQLVLWLEREKKWPSPGLFCSNIQEALYALVLFSIGSEQGKPRKTAICIVCGAVIVRAPKGGDRRKTCSEKCRKRWTRAQQNQN